MVDLKAYRNEQSGRWFMEGVEPETQTYDRIVTMLKEGINFKFARYGDGEINAMIGKDGQNCDGHKYFNDLGFKLVETIRYEPSYMVGIQPLSVNHLGEHVKHYFGDFKTLYNADALHSASIDGVLERFFKALTGRYLIVIAPPHLAGLFECVHIVIPPVDCWLSYDRIKEQLEYHLIDDAVILLCASMMSEVLISDFKDRNCTMIDCGSLFDPYAGVKSRRYHHKLKM